MASGSKRERSPGVWQLRVGSGQDPVTGKYLARTEQVRGTSAQANKRLKELVREVDRAKDVGTDTMTTVGGLLDMWWPLAKTKLSPSTVKNETWFIEAIIKPRIGKMPLARLDVAALDRFYVMLSERGGAKGGPLAPASVRRVHNVMSSALARAVTYGWIAKNPAAEAEPPSLPVRRVTPPTASQVRDLVEEASSVNFALPVFLRLAAITGARRSELVALRWSDVDLTAGRITIAHGVVATADKTLVRKDTKTHSARTVSLGASAVDMLTDLRTDQAKLALDLGQTLDADPFVFSFAPDGSEPWRPDYPTRALSVIRERLGIKVRLHDLRHFMATQWLSGGVDVRTVAGRLGHSKPSMTLNVYSHFMPDVDKDAADRMDALV